MPLLNVVPPEEAEGKVKEAYAIFDQMGMVPRPMQMYSPSPGLIDLRRRSIMHFMTHPNLSPGLLALIRMLVAEEMNFDYCVSLNSQILKAVGIASDDQLAAIMADPATAPLTDKERHMLLFVIKAVKTPEAVEAADVDYLRALGWSDGDIVDACSHGAEMVSSGILFKAFNMGEGESC